MKEFLPSFLLKILINSLNYDWLIDKGPVHPYPNAFENASTRSVCESFSPVHMKTRKRYPLLSMRHAYDVFKWCIFGVWHHRIRNLHFCPIKHEVQANEQKKTTTTTRENEKYVGKEINLLLLPLGLLALNYQSPSSTNCVKWKKRQIFNNYWMRLSIL